MRFAAYARSDVMTKLPIAPISEPTKARTSELSKAFEDIRKYLREARHASVRKTTSNKTTRTQATSAHPDARAATLRTKPHRTVKKRF